MFGASPNISGAATNSLNGPNSYWVVGGTGSLYNNGSKADVPMVGLAEDRTVERSSSGSINLSAARSSSVYTGSKVQPAALQILACIRT